MARRIAALTAIGLALAATCHGQMRLFDMGPVDSPVWFGADSVDASMVYDTERGYGWESEAGLVARRRPVNDDLGGDFVTGGGTFIVDVEPHAYSAWALLNDSGDGINPPRFWTEPYGISGNDEEIVSVPQGMESFLSGYFHANWDVDWDPSRSLFQKLFGKYDQAHEFPIAAREGRISITFTDNCPVAAIVVWPAHLRLESLAVLAAIDEARRDRFDSGYDRARAPSRLRPGSYTSGARRRGYAVWRRSIDDKAYPYTQPAEHERARRIDVLACLGEKEPFSLCIRPLESLSAVTVTLDELKGPRGATLGEDQIDVALVKYVERLTKPGTYEVQPRELLPAEPRDLTTGITRQYWITLDISEDLAPGKYRGMLTVDVENRKPTQLPVRLNVLPVELSPPPMLAGMYYYMPDAVDYRAFRGDTLAPAVLGQIRAQLADMRAHGMTTVAVSPPPLIDRDESGALSYDEPAWRRFGEFIAAYREAGFTEPIPAYQLAHQLMAQLPGKPAIRGEDAWRPGEEFDPGFRAEYEQAVRMFYERARSLDWPEIILYASDELSIHGERGGAWGLEHLSLLHGIRSTMPEAFRICASVNGVAEHALVSKLDIAIANRDFPLCAEALDEISQAGAETWLYNLGPQRFTWGYYPARCGAKGRLQWHYRTAPTGTCDPHNWLTSSAWGVTPGPDGPLRNVDWELAREGIDDARLVATLRAAIAEAKKSGAARVKIADAEADLTWVMDSIDPDFAHYADKTGFWDGAMYEKLKSMLARHCDTLSRRVRQ
ncbi:MAG TPA: hypothetical protein QGH10_15155 [Armatimonadota bacterium]|nr:hypothetical protein [Armatimonadota bacterium]